jgi:hypothetical protein
MYTIRNSSLRCNLRELNHEQLVTLAAELACALSDIASGNHFDDAQSRADAALRNTCVEAIYEMSLTLNPPKG